MRSCVSRRLKKIWLVTQVVACIKCENLGVPMSRTANHITWTFSAIGQRIRLITVRFRVRVPESPLNSISQLDRILKNTNNNKVAENCVIGSIPCNAWHTYGVRKKGLKAPYCVWSHRFKCCQGGLREVGRYGYCDGLKIHRSWVDTNTSH